MEKKRYKKTLCQSPALIKKVDKGPKAIPAKNAHDGTNNRKNAFWRRNTYLGADRFASQKREHHPRAVSLSGVIPDLVSKLFEEKSVESGFFTRHSAVRRTSGSENGAKVKKIEKEKNLKRESVLELFRFLRCDH